jgi:hypothetical protein
MVVYVPLLDEEYIHCSLKLITSIKLQLDLEEHDTMK